jgi:hypothetical protein
MLKKKIMPSKKNHGRKRTKKYPQQQNEKQENKQNQKQETKQSNNVENNEKRDPYKVGNLLLISDNEGNDYKDLDEMWNKVASDSTQWYRKAGLLHVCLFVSFWCHKTIDMLFNMFFKKFNFEFSFHFFFFISITIFFSFIFSKMNIGRM